MEGKSHLIQNDQTIFSGSQQERTPQNYPDQAVSNESCTVTTEAMDTAGVSEMQAFRSDTVLTGGKRTYLVQSLQILHNRMLIDLLVWLRLHTVTKKTMKHLPKVLQNWVISKNLQLALNVGKKS